MSSGHDEVNTYKDSTGRRHCRTCRRLAYRRVDVTETNPRVVS